MPGGQHQGERLRPHLGLVRLHPVCGEDADASRRPERRSPPRDGTSAVINSIFYVTIGNINMRSDKCGIVFVENLRRKVAGCANRRRGPFSSF